MNQVNQTHPLSLTSCALVCSLLLLGCEDASSEDVDVATDTQGGGMTEPHATSSTHDGETGEGEGSSGDAVDPRALLDCEDADFTVIMPLSGPGYDPEQGLIEPVQDQYVVHTTQLVVNPDAASQEEFFELVGGVQEQLMQTPGFVALSLAFEPNCGSSRTMGIWRSEQDMYAFVGSGAHAQAMGRTTAISVTGRTTHWEADLAQMPPTWEQTLQRLVEVDPLGY